MRRIAAAALVVAAVLASPGYFLCMPGQARGGGDRAKLPVQRDDLHARVRVHVKTLAVDIGGRGTTRPDALEKAAQYIEHEWESQGYAVERHTYDAHGVSVANLEIELAGDGDGDADEVVVVGAHYDSAGEMPGADDNASGVAALLVLSGALAGRTHRRRIRFVAFANEEPPHFQTETMGSLVYAKRLRQDGESVAAMLSIETIGYFRDDPGSQRYPPVFASLYPDRGDFIGFVGSARSVRLVRRATSTFRSSSELPAYGVAAPMAIPGIGWSDHWSFDQVGFPALMVTDTAPFRNPHYHEPTDLPDELDYARMTDVIVGLADVIVDLADAR